MKAKKGIDVSVWQGEIDWEKAKADGVEFAMLRAGSGDGSIDGQFYRNISACNRLGIPCGVYWFSYAYTEDMAAREAQHCAAVCKQFRVTYPVAFDFEYDSLDYARKQGVTVDQALASSLARAFLREVQAAGYTPMLYTNPDFLSRYYDKGLPEEFPVWLARYPAAPPAPEPRPEGAAIWQWGAATVDGISGKVDMDYGYVDYDETGGGEKEDETVIRYNTVAELPDWAKPTILQLIGRKAIQGRGAPLDADGNPTDMDLSLDMVRMFVINDRAGAYGE